MSSVFDSGGVRHDAILAGDGTAVPSVRNDAVDDVGFARLDLDRAARTGDPEVVFGAGKSPAQLVVLLRRLADAHGGRAVLATRCSRAGIDACRNEIPDVVVDEVAGTLVVGEVVPPAGLVVILTEGTADLPVARESKTTVAVFGAGAELIPDVGVSGIHRLLAVRARVLAADAVIVVAGMEGALPSVVGGLVRLPLIAVPTSVGYGLPWDRVTALLAMLNSCGPGMTVVNVDNGFGAGVAAARIARAVGRARDGRIRT